MIHTSLLRHNPEASGRHRIGTGMLIFIMNMNDRADSPFVAERANTLHMTF